MSERASSVLDHLNEGRRAGFDGSLAKVIAHALEKQVTEMFASADKMHQAVYGCLVDKE